MALTKTPIELSSTPSIVDGGNATAITIDSSERILIGADSGDAFNDDAMLRLQRTGDRVFIQLKTDADQNSAILFGDVDDDVECAIEYEPANKALTLSTGDNTEAMRIDSNQAVGINMNPNGYGQLSVNGTGVVLALRASSGAGQLGFYEGGSGRFYLKSLNGWTSCMLQSER